MRVISVIYLFYTPLFVYSSFIVKAADVYYYDEPFTKIHFCQFYRSHLDLSSYSQIHCTYAPTYMYRFIIHLFHGINNHFLCSVYLVKNIGTKLRSRLSQSRAIIFFWFPCNAFAYNTNLLFSSTSLSQEKLR